MVVSANSASAAHLKKNMEIASYVVAYKAYVSELLLYSSSLDRARWALPLLRCCPARCRYVAHRAALAANAAPPPFPCACGRPSNGLAVQKRAGPEMDLLQCAASPAMGLPRAKPAEAQR